MTKIMFVCHGNICRSPMAEFVMKKLVSDKGISDKFLIRSSATSTEEIGNSIYPPAKKELFRQGIPFNERQAVKIEAREYHEYDMFVVMDDANVRNLTRIFGGDPEKKIKKLMDFTEKNGNVADPWYTDDYETAFRDIREGCMGLFKYIGE